MATALITGITGQDGAYLSRLLLDKGYEVVGLVRDSAVPNTSRLQALGADRDVRLMPVNLMDLSNLTRAIGQARPDEIYNLASQSSVGLSFAQPIGTVELNVLSTLNLLESVRLLALAPRIYQASSSEMYGRVDDLPISEGTAMHPMSPYAASKAAAHWLTINYRESYGMYCCCGILFNHESALRGSQFVSYKIITSALAIAGGSRERLRLGNLSVRRDWGYAPDYVNAIWLMLQQEYPEDYVVASGKSHSLEEFTERVFAAVGLDWREHVDLDPDLHRPADIPDSFGDAAKARDVLGWSYSLSFPELIERLVVDYRQLGQGA